MAGIGEQERQRQADNPVGPFTSDVQAVLEDAVRQILVGIGEDPEREGLELTPHRVAKMYGEVLEGYNQQLDEIVNGALFEVKYGKNDIIVAKDIEFHSMCEHHMLPFTGIAHVAYIPSDRVIGISKIPRIVDMFARRLQVQERLCNEVADALVQALDPKGAMVIMEAEHSCVALRGVEKHGMAMTTTARRGVFENSADARNDFYRVLERQN